MPKAVVCRELGPPERLRLETFAAAPLTQGQVRVAVHAAGINFPDILMAAGEYQLKPELPFTPGVEAAGEVTEIADGVAGVAVGDRVIVRMRYGAYADEAVVAPSQLTRCRPTSTMRRAQRCWPRMAPPITRWSIAARFSWAKCCWCTAPAAASVLPRSRSASCSGQPSSRRRHRRRSLASPKPAAPIISCSTTREPFREAVKRITDGRGADVVFDPVGGEIFENSLRCIGWGARILVVGFTGGIGVARTNLLLIKGASVLGVRAGEAARRNPAAGEARLKALWQWAEAGTHPAAYLAPVAARRMSRRRCGF